MGKEEEKGKAEEVAEKTGETVGKGVKKAGESLKALEKAWSKVLKERKRRKTRKSNASWFFLGNLLLEQDSTFFIST